jgi:dienelactone hydrolase
MDPKAMDLLDKIMAPAPSIMGTLQKPLYVVQAMSMAIPWKMKTGIPTTYPKVQAFIKGLRTSEPPFKTDNLKIGVAGFCWGGKHTFLLAHDEESTRVQRHESQVNYSKPERLVDCAFTAHPSYLEVPKDVDPVTIPISVVVGDKDQVLSGPLAQQTKEILDGKNAGHEVTILPDAKHGFAVRMHTDDKHEMECAAKAEEQALAWFKKHLA